MKGHLKRNRMVQISAPYHLPLRSYACGKKFDQNVHGFGPESENFDYGQKGYHVKGHLKRSRMALISAS